MWTSLLTQQSKFSNYEDSIPELLTVHTRTMNGSYCNYELLLREYEPFLRK
ncbi:hypothetical protein EZS27_021612 [termite gut metagenome]|uniref:Uncharacterized protein n=1 Tax=termite gut metagenome TaxID=433724 RepID=A0A5J4R7H1_9ZZZZ